MQCIKLSTDWSIQYCSTVKILNVYIIFMLKIMMVLLHTVYYTRW
jgi:hypothetical protein